MSTTVVLENVTSDQRRQGKVPLQEHNQWPVKVNMMNGDKLHLTSNTHSSLNKPN
jgi:hypothetical protein